MFLVGFNFSFFFLFFSRLWQNSWQGGKGRSKDNPEAGTVPLPTQETRLCRRGRRVWPEGWDVGRSHWPAETTAGRVQSLPDRWGETGPAGCPTRWTSLTPADHPSQPHSGLRKGWGSPGTAWAEPHCSAADPNSRSKQPLLSVF